MHTQYKQSYEKLTFILEKKKKICICASVRVCGEGRCRVRITQFCQVNYGSVKALGRDCSEIGLYN